MTRYRGHMIWRGKYPDASTANKSFLIEFDPLTKTWVRENVELFAAMQNWLHIHSYEVLSVPAPNNLYSDVSLHDEPEWYEIRSVLYRMSEDGIIELTTSEPTSDLEAPAPYVPGRKY